MTEFQEVCKLYDHSKRSKLNAKIVEVLKNAKLNRGNPICEPKVSQTWRPYTMYSDDDDTDQEEQQNVDNTNHYKRRGKQAQAQPQRNFEMPKRQSLRQMLSNYRTGQVPIYTKSIPLDIELFNRRFEQYFEKA